ncbi:MAG: hypothetical protein SWZ49_07140 [Cyanobacteriota bacterium]|nr:hypothetical protein [Cyanobacteriota bacterium]
MINKLELPNQLREKVDKELEIGESIRWIGQPIPRFFTVSSVGSFLFAIPWTGFVVFWVLTASRASIFFALFGIPFLIVGFGMLSSPIWFWLSAKNTAYVITNKRALSISVPVTLFANILSTTIRNYPPSKLKDIYRKERANGTGDVVMGVQQSNRYLNNRRNQTTEEIGFMGIRNPREVEKMLRQLAEDD